MPNQNRIRSKKQGGKANFFKKNWGSIVALSLLDLVMVESCRTVVAELFI